MQDFPQGLIFVLVFGAIWLAQLVFKRLRRNAAAVPTQAQARSASGADTQTAPRVPLRPGRQTLRAGAADPPTPVEAPRSAPDAVGRASPLARRPARRFSTAALMPNRRAVQDAVVIAAILQPCHAQRTHDFG